MPGDLFDQFQIAGGFEEAASWLQIDHVADRVCAAGIDCGELDLLLTETTVVIRARASNKIAWFKKTEALAA